MSKYTDERVKLTNEILQGIRAIKSYNWEQPFTEQLNNLRIKELNALQASANTRGVLIGILSAAPSFVAVITLAVYSFLGNTLTPSKVFTALTLFNQLRFPLIFYPMVINALAEGKISLERLTKFFDCNEVENYINREESLISNTNIDNNSNITTSSTSSNSIAIQIENGNFSWTNPKSNQNQMKSDRGSLFNTNIKINKGELVAVIGPVGSGKSTLLSALLGELYKTTGNISVIGSVAYVPQTSWIPNESLRNVILFGKPYEWKRYREIIRICGLERDLQLLESGDQTEIGERGVNLSGGQKQRVGIARAVYDNADIYLFDDPLSALDSEVGLKVFSDCIKNTLRDKTRILVTHQLSVLPKTDRIVIMGNNNEDGSCHIVAQGTYNELIAQGYDISYITKQYEQDKAKAIEIEKEKDKEKDTNNSIINKDSIDLNVHTNDDESENGNGNGNEEDNYNATSLNLIQFSQVSSYNIESTLFTNDSIAISIPVTTATTSISSTVSSSSITTSTSTNSNKMNPYDITHFIRRIMYDHNTKPDSNSKSKSTPSWTDMMDISYENNNNNKDSSDKSISVTALSTVLTASAVTPLTREAGDYCTGPDCPILDIDDDKNSNDSDAIIAKVPIDEILNEDELKRLQSQSSGSGGTSSSSLSSSSSGVTAAMMEEIGIGSGDSVLAGGSSSIRSSSSSSSNIKDNELSLSTSTDKSLPSLSSTTTASSQSDSPLNSVSMTVSVSDEELAESVKLPVRLMTKEERGEGAVGWNIYMSYLKATKQPLLILCVLFSIILGNGSQLLQQWVVAAWTSDPFYTKYPLKSYLSGVAMTASSVAVFNYFRTYISCMAGMLASRSLHNDLVSRVLRAPLNFFESTPVGRLMQRFSKDLDSIDQQLPNSLGQVVTTIFSILTSMSAICMITPSFGIIMIPVVTIYYSLTNYYRNVARDLKRLEAISRSPLFAHFSETLGGISVIRCFKREQNFIHTNEMKIDDNLAALFSLKAVDRWLSVRLEFLGNIIVMSSAVLVLLSGSKAGAAGVSLNSALSVTSTLNWAVRNAVDTEALMNSVERVLYTTNKTPQELPAFVFENNNKMKMKKNQNINSINSSGSNNSKIPIHMENIDYLENSNILLDNNNNSSTSTTTNHLNITDDELKTSGWPWRGGITMNDVCMRYRDDFEPVLQGVTAKIYPGESVGIVGRTGSGKSSLFRALLRLTELERGSIRIDGVDVGDVGLNVLRSSVSIIPQDPILFSGSIRSNLDPMGTANGNDDILWRALKKSHLRDTIRSLPGGLSFVVTEGGDNFSSGQKQLLCLARALIRQSRLLLLDEATSSVDSDTDELIQRTIREEFGGRGCTVLTIAHRLRTILDADKILVMDAGRVAEFASPEELLNDSNSIFARLVAAERQTNDILSNNKDFMMNTTSSSTTINAMNEKSSSDSNSK